MERSTSSISRGSWSSCGTWAVSSAASDVPCTDVFEATEVVTQDDKRLLDLSCCFFSLVDAAVTDFLFRQQFKKCSVEKTTCNYFDSRSNVDPVFSPVWLIINTLTNLRHFFMRLSCYCSWISSKHCPQTALTILCWNSRTNKRTDAWKLTSSWFSH